MKINLGVVFGGKTVEHEISIISALQAINNINEDKYNVVPIYIAKEGSWYTGDILKEIDSYKDLESLYNKVKKVNFIEKDNRYFLQEKSIFNKIVNEIDIVFPIVHGTNVEDGVLQGFFQTIGIPCVGNDVYSSVMGQDKVFMKEMWKSIGLPMTKYTWFYDVDYEKDVGSVMLKIKQLTFPMIVKPATTGSSVGISICKDEEELKESIADAMNYDKKILVEEVVQNLKELNIAVLGNYDDQKVSAIEEVFAKSEFLTFEDKYIGNSKGGQKSNTSKGMLSTSRNIPAEISEELKNKVEDVAKKAFKVIGASSNSRIDFLVDDKTQNIYINEINSIPGSLAFYLWEASNVKYNELLDQMIKLGISEHKSREKKTFVFESNVLQGFKFNKGLKK